MKNLKNRAIIFAGNHNSRKFDAIVSTAAIIIPTGCFSLRHFLPVRYLAYQDYFKWFRFKRPFVFPFSFISALWLRLNNSIPIKDRKKEEFNNTPLKDILSQAIIALNNKERIFIFPEGMTGGDNKLRRGKRGVACLHKETGVSVVPVGISGTYEMFSIKNLLKPRSEKKIVINFGKPIHDLWEEGERKSLKAGADRVMGEIAKLIY